MWIVIIRVVQGHRYSFCNPGVHVYEGYSNDAFKQK